MQLILKKNQIKTWPKKKKFLFNPSKAKVTIISIQMSHYYHLNNTNKVKITCNNRSIEKTVQGYKLLRLIIAEKFGVNCHANKVLEDGYPILKTLKHLK